MSQAPSREDLLRRVGEQQRLIEEQERELEDARETLQAIGSGSVDAVVVYGPNVPRVYTLQGADEVYRVLFETLNEGALTLSTEGVILAANSRFARLAGVPLEDVIGCALAAFVAPPDAPTLPALLERACDGGVQREIALRRADGAAVPVLLSANAVLVDGKPDAVTAVVADLTELRRAQEALRKAHTDLERKVEERTAELREEVAERARAEEALREGDRRKDQFLAMLSHELRNPLAAVAAAVHVLRQRCPPDPLQMRAQDAADRQMNHLRRMLDDLLDVSRITRGKVGLRVERVLLSRIVEDGIQIALPRLQERGHRLSVSLPPEAVELDADPTRLSQALGNLLSNAAKFTPTGGQVWVTACREGDQVAIRVRDTGVGIEPALLPHIFDLFTQGSQGADRAQGGLGLGLTLAREYVEMHGGTIEVSSDGPGKGSEFVVRLPAVAPEPRVQGSVLNPEPWTPNPSRRILLVEDNADAAELMAMLLEGEGHQVAVAHSGPVALRLAAETHPEVVLLDIGLPGMDGCEVGRRLRAEDGTRGATLIALTGYGQDEDRERTRAAGFDEHLVKPVDMNALRRLLLQGASG